MAVLLVLRSKVDDSQQYFLSGTGWVTDKTTATTYATKEASLVDGETLRESLGPAALLGVQDQSTGEIHAVPGWTD